MSKSLVSIRYCPSNWIVYLKVTDDFLFPNEIWLQNIHKTVLWKLGPTLLPPEYGKLATKPVTLTGPFSQSLENLLKTPLQRIKFIIVCYKMADYME